MSGGNQSAVIFGFLFAAFFVYITIKGELPTYAGLLLLSPAQASSSGQAQPTASQQATSTQQAVVSTAIESLFFP